MISRVQFYFTTGRRPKKRCSRRKIIIFNKTRGASARPRDLGTKIVGDSGVTNQRERLISRDLEIRRKSGPGR